MTIEVRQLLIKSTVQRKVGDGSGTSDDTTSRESCPDVEEIKETVLAECRQLVVELLREKQER